MLGAGEYCHDIYGIFVCFETKHLKERIKGPFHSFAVTMHLFPIKQLAIYRIKADKNDKALIKVRFLCIQNLISPLLTI